MILRYELPKEAEQVISLTDNERIYYAVPVDIDDAGNFLEDSYFIVTNRRYAGQAMTEPVQTSQNLFPAAVIFSFML